MPRCPSPESFTARLTLRPDDNPLGHWTSLVRGEHDRLYFVRAKGRGKTLECIDLMPKIHDHLAPFWVDYKIIDDSPAPPPPPPAASAKAASSKPASQAPPVASSKASSASPSKSASKSASKTASSTPSTPTSTQQTQISDLTSQLRAAQRTISALQKALHHAEKRLRGGSHRRRRRSPPASGNHQPSVPAPTSGSGSGSAHPAVEPEPELAPAPAPSHHSSGSVRSTHRRSAHGHQPAPVRATNIPPITINSGEDSPRAPLTASNLAIAGGAPPSAAQNVGRDR